MAVSAFFFGVLWNLTLPRLFAAPRLGVLDAFGLVCLIATVRVIK